MESSLEDQDFYRRMAEVVARRYRLTAGKTLRDVYQLDAAFLNTESDADFAFRSRDIILRVLADPARLEALVDLFVHLTVEFTYASNQFIQITPEEERVLRRIYTSYLHDLERMLSENSTAVGISTGMRSLVAGHFQDLRHNIARFFDAEARENEHENVILQKAVCAEYSPELQLEIIGVDLAVLVPPVLDLGCGKSGRLVHYLNRQGVQTVGVDRMVEASPHLLQADWLHYPLEPQRWGTVISHMAFSNHFVFQHLYRHGSVEPYARQYMAILRSLKPGGSFYYTPGLPFIEAYLPRDPYVISKRWVVESDKLYACRVFRSG